MMNGLHCYIQSVVVSGVDWTVEIIMTTLISLLLLASFKFQTILACRLRFLNLQLLLFFFFAAKTHSTPNFSPTDESELVGTPEERRFLWDAKFAR